MSTEPKDWVIKTATLSKSGGLHVTGTNTCTRDELFREFSWHIEHHSIESDRYDWTNTVWGEGARAMFERLLKRRMQELQSAEVR